MNYLWVTYSPTHDQSIIKQVDFEVGHVDRFVESFRYNPLQDAPKVGRVEQRHRRVVHKFPNNGQKHGPGVDCSPGSPRVLQQDFEFDWGR